MNSRHKGGTLSRADKKQTNSVYNLATVWMVIVSIGLKNLRILIFFLTKPNFKVDSWFFDSVK